MSKRIESMNILIVEYLAPIGHVGYVSYHINTLLDLGHNITFYTHDNFYKECKIPSVLFKNFPKFLYCQVNNPLKPIIERVQGIIKLLIIDLFLIFNKYDVIIFTSYDIMSFWIFRTKSPTFIVNHNNTTDFTSSIKKSLHHSISSKFTHVALAPFIQDYLKQYLRNKVIMIPHGLTKKYHRIKEDNRSLFGGRFVYIHTTSSCNKYVLTQVLQNENLRSYLQNNKLKLVVKSYTYKSDDKNIIVLPHFIDGDMYARIMGEAMAVFAPYNDNTFHFRVSAVLMECFGSNIPIISTPSLSYSSYSDFITYPFIVDSPESFIEAIDTISKTPSSSYYKNINQLSAKNYWEEELRF